MYIIVVGASPEGSSFIELALDNGHRLALIEPDEAKARSVLQKHDIEVFQANIATGGILDEAQAHQADAILAATNDDSANLMAMFLGQQYHIKTLISMVNESQHRSLFEKLGVEVLVNPEAIVAKHLYRMLSPKSF
ncbi:TrkA family potassium uptake protein [filamentous cyanobacterium CCP2]|nr:TrkA family potassium uptake protein [filamentous cyanobacterium CCP2]